MAIFRNLLILLLACSFSFTAFANQPTSIEKKGIELPLEGLVKVLDFSIEKQGIMYNKQAMVWSNANSDTRVFGLTVDQEEVMLNTRGTAIEKVVYENLYFNIDLIVHIPASNDRREISYEFVVYPGGNPADISLDYVSGYVRPGGEAYLLDDETESLRLSAPMGMQVLAGTDEQKVKAKFSSKGNKLQLNTENYNQSEILTLFCKQL